MPEAPEDDRYLSSEIDIDFLAMIFNSRISHKYFIGFRSGDCIGHSISFTGLFHTCEFQFRKNENQFCKSESQFRKSESQFYINENQFCNSKSQFCKK